VRRVTLIVRALSRLPGGPGRPVSFYELVPVSFSLVPGGFLAQHGKALEQIGNFLLFPGFAEA
jgi:hypothetical protein